MGRYLDTWMIATVNATVLLSNHVIVLLVDEVITMTLAEVEDEVILTAVAEMEEDAEGGGWVVEDLTSVSEEVEAAGGGAEDSTMIEEEEVEKVVDQTMVVEVEVGTDESLFEEWMTYHHAIVKEIDHVTCHHEEVDSGICLVMDRSETVFGNYHEETKCLEISLESYHEGMKCLETAPENYHEEMYQENSQTESNLAEMDPEIFNVEMELATLHKEMS